MMFSLKTIVSFAFAASLASANSVTFVNQDATQRTLVFTADIAHEKLDDVTIPSFQEVTVNFPGSWIGNVFSVSEGAPRVTGMLAEFVFQGFEGKTFYDVSAIVNPYDHHGIKELYPASQKGLEEKENVSGCDVFPCNSVYYNPDDEQTHASEETDFICTLGTSSPSNTSGVAARGDRPGLLARKFMLRKY
jgi:hypothetical protein